MRRIMEIRIKYSELKACESKHDMMENLINRIFDAGYYKLDGLVFKDILNMEMFYMPGPKDILFKKYP